MEMNIVVATHNVNYSQIKSFLKSFSDNCIDKYKVTIRLVIPKFDVEFFNKLSIMFKDLRIIIHPLCQLLEKYRQYDQTEIQLFEKVGRQSFISIKKILGILESSAERVCVFNSDTIFIRKFCLEKYISNNWFKYYYCSKSVSRNGEPQNNINLQNVQNNIFGINDRHWYREVRTWIFDKRVVLDMYNFLINKYKKLSSIETDFIFDYCYYLFYKHHTDMYPVVSWVDTYFILENILQFDKFSLFCDKTPNYNIVEQAGNLITNNPEEIPTLQYIYNTLCIPIYGFEANNINHQLFILSFSQIYIIHGNPCNLVSKLIKKNAYNLKIALGISGILRNDDDITPLVNFIGPYKIDTFFYITIEDKLRQNQIIELFRPKNIIIDNCRPYNTAVAKFKQPNTKAAMVSNTCSMFYKKRRLSDMISDDYDMIINIRPDLVSLDGKQLLHIILNILLKYDNNILYVPKIYHSFGVTDTIAIGHFNLMKKYFQLYDKIDKFINHYIFNPEYLVYKHLSESDIDLDVFDWTYKIYRHPITFLDFWWRFEFDIENNVKEYLRLKVSSFETYFTKFLPTPRKRYRIMNKSTSKFLYIDGDKVVLNETLFSHFLISHRHDLFMRINIKYDTNMPNLNNDDTGWNLFVLPNSNKIEGKGNNDTWAQFYVTFEENYFYLATFHTHTIKNRTGTFGRYIGVKDGCIVTDLPRCHEAQWYII